MTVEEKADKAIDSFCTKYFDVFNVPYVPTDKEKALLAESELVNNYGMETIEGVLTEVFNLLCANRNKPIKPKIAYTFTDRWKEVLPDVQEQAN